MASTTAEPKMEPHEELQDQHPDLESGGLTEAEEEEYHRRSQHTTHFYTVYDDAG